jgi:hypothetical protein
MIGLAFGDAATQWLGQSRHTKSGSYDTCMVIVVGDKAATAAAAAALETYMVS